MDGPFPSEAGEVECEVCGAVVRFRDSEQQVERTLKWILHAFPYKEGVLEVLTCGACSKLREDWILQGHTARIRAGWNLNYH